MRDREFQKRRLFVTLLLAAVIIVFPQATFSQITTPQAQFIIGPQVPISNSWFDKTEVARAKAHGEAFPAEPPSPMTDEYIFGNYYDLALTEYIAYQRAGDPAFLGYARKVADSWWKCAWIKQGSVRNFDSAGPAPRHASLGGLILRALDGRPEMWDWLNSYTRYHFDLWLKRRVNDRTLYYGVREGAFMLHYAAWLAKVLPDSFPLQSGGTAKNGAALRAAYRANVEAVAVNYYGRLQRADGSWRWDDPDYTDADGGKLVGITQPFMIGLLLNALIDIHRLTANQNVANQIVKSCRYLYSAGPYRKDDPVPVAPTKRWRSFWYFYHGGTTVNPKKYEKGGGSEDGTQLWHVSSERQSISTIFDAYGYAYLLTKDASFKAMGDDLFDAAFVGTDGIRGLAADNDRTHGPKNYNQVYRMGGRYLAWRSAAAQAATATTTPVP
jgi:hypothetical protein